MPPTTFTTRCQEALQSENVPGDRGRDRGLVEDERHAVVDEALSLEDRDERGAAP